MAVNASPGGRREDKSQADAQDVEGVEALLAHCIINAEFNQFLRGRNAAAEIEALIESAAFIADHRRAKRGAVGKLILGSVAQELLLSVPCPVLAV